MHLLEKGNPLHNSGGKSAGVIAAKTNVEYAKSTQNFIAEDIASSKKAEKPKESCLEYENPQYSSDISPIINTENQS